MLSASESTVEGFPEAETRAAQGHNLKRISHFPTMGPGGFGASSSVASTPKARGAIPPTSRLSGQHDTLVSVI